MITHIGIVAGEIWSLLEECGDMDLKELMKKIKEQGLDIDKESLLMSLGWLAREGHLLVRKEEGGYAVCLRD